MKSVGIHSTEKPLKSLKDNAVPCELAIQVLKHAAEKALWKPGKIWRRLFNLRPNECPTEGWMNADFVAASVVTTPKADVRERDLRLRQLKITWEPYVRDMSIDEIAEHYRDFLDDDASEALRRMPSWSHLEKSDNLKMKILEAVEKKHGRSDA
jgi:hypothetical protein